MTEFSDSTLCHVFTPQVVSPKAKVQTTVDWQLENWDKTVDYLWCLSQWQTAHRKRPYSMRSLQVQILLKNTYPWWSIVTLSVTGQAPLSLWTKRLHPTLPYKTLQVSVLRRILQKSHLHLFPYPNGRAPGTSLENSYNQTCLYLPTIRIFHVDYWQFSQ